MNVDGIRAYAQYCVDRIGEGGQTKVAKRCGISDAAVSTFLAGKYAAKEDGVAMRIANGLHYWDCQCNVVRTVTSYLEVKHAFDMAKSKSKWVCISSRSGSGKTHSLMDLYNTSVDDSVIYLRCRKWGARKFLTKLATVFGVGVTRYHDCDMLLDEIKVKVNGVSASRPILILDDAGKLSNSAMQLFIPLYDDTKGRMGCMVAGTETLERTIKRNVGRVEGYDEIDSRMGRNYISLCGATKRDVVAMCMANGIADKAVAEDIYGDLPKQKVRPNKKEDKSYDFVTDLREVMAKIDDVLCRQQLENGGVLR